jgi:hypothetical protein
LSLQGPLFHKPITKAPQRRGYSLKRLPQVADVFGFLSTKVL